MDLASLYNNAHRPSSCSPLNYTSVLSSNLFLEGQFSQQDYGDDGHRLAVHRPRQGHADLRPIARHSPRFNSPTFCAVCGSGWHEQRNNWDCFVKFALLPLHRADAGRTPSSPASTTSRRWRKNDNYQSGSQYRVYATRRSSTAPTHLPGLQNGNTTYIQYLPLVAAERRATTSGPTRSSSTTRGG